MMKFIPASTRWQADYGRLKTAYSFSFGDWYNPSRMWFGVLRVLNDDIIDGGNGFPEHPHNNMEIITIVTAWALQHADSMGNGGVIKAWDVQVMSAWNGIHHSEFNASQTDATALFQLWIQPHTANIVPRYDQKSFNRQQIDNTWNLVVSPDARDGSLAINQNAFISLAVLNSELEYTLHSPDNWLFVMSILGNVEIGQYTLKSRDALEITDTNKLMITPDGECKIMIIEVPMKV